MKMLFLLLAMGLAACSSDPYAVNLPSDPSAWEGNEELRGAIERIPEDEREVVLAYLARHTLAKAFGEQTASPVGVTLGEALAEQREWAAEQARKEAEARALARKLEKERAEREKKLNDAVTVAVTSLKLRPANPQRRVFQSTIAVSIGFDNKTDRPIAGVQGILHFNDMFGKSIKSVNVSFDEGVPASGNTVWPAELRYNQFIQEDVKLGNTPLEKMKVVWSPQTIIFEDGETLQVP